MKIRKAKAKDIGRIVELWWEMETSHSGYDTVFYAKKSKKVYGTAPGSWGK